MAVGGIGWGQAVSGLYARGRRDWQPPTNGSCDVDCLHCGARHTTSAKVLPAYLQMRLEYGESRRSSSERPVALKQAERAGKTDRG